MKKKYSLNNINTLSFTIKSPCVIFLKGDLGSGKTTLSKYIINHILGIKMAVTSPTYTYYNRYENVYHFDLYRLANYDEFFAIGGEDIFENNNGIILVEWPEIIEKYYKCDIEIRLFKTFNQDIHEIEIVQY